ncbi:MAG: hypothetical protein AB7Q42_06780 [Acidimicrobiia bacterium]
MNDVALREVRAGARQEAASRRAPAKKRPELVVVPRSRRTVRFAALTFTIVFALMLALTVFQTRLAENQLDIDRAEEGVDIARARFSELRKENASLRSPERIAAEAAKLGLVPGRSSAFIVVDPAVVQMVAVAAGDGLDPQGIGGLEDPFEVHKRVKRVVSGEAP